MSGDEIRQRWFALKCACFGVGKRIARRDGIPPYAQQYISRWLDGYHVAPPTPPRMRMGSPQDESGASELCCALAMIGMMENLPGEYSSIMAIQDAVWETLVVAARKSGLDIDEVIARSEEIAPMLAGSAAITPDNPAHPIEARAVARLIRMSDAYSAESRRRSAPMSR